MTVHNLYIFDRNGSCLYYNEWNRKKQAGISKEEVSTACLPVCLPACLWSLACLSLRKEGFLSFQTSRYRLHYYETPSGLRSDDEPWSASSTGEDLQTSTDHHRPSQSVTVHHRPPQSITVRHSPPQTSTVHHSPSQTSTVHHRPPQSTTDLHSPSQSVIVHNRPPQSITDLHSPSQSITDLHSPPQTSTVHHSPPQTSTVRHRPPQSITVHHRPPQSITDLHSPSQSITDLHSPSQSITDLHSPSQTSTVHHRPPQSITVHHRPPQSVTDLHSPSQSITDLHSPSQTSTVHHRPPQSIIVRHRPPQSITDLHSPSQSITDLHSPSQSITDLHSPSQTSTLSAVLPVVGVASPGAPPPDHEAPPGLVVEVEDTKTNITVSFAIFIIAEEEEGSTVGGRGRSDDGSRSSEIDDITDDVTKTQDIQPMREEHDDHVIVTEESSEEMMSDEPMRNDLDDFNNSTGGSEASPPDDLSRHCQADSSDPDPGPQQVTGSSSEETGSLSQDEVGSGRCVRGGSGLQEVIGSNQEVLDLLAGSQAVKGGHQEVLRSTPDTLPGFSLSSEESLESSVHHTGSTESSQRVIGPTTSFTSNCTSRSTSQLTHSSKDSQEGGGLSGVTRSPEVSSSSEEPTLPFTSSPTQSEESGSSGSEPDCPGLHPDHIPRSYPVSPDSNRKASSEVGPEESESSSVPPDDAIRGANSASVSASSKANMDVTPDSSLKEAEEESSSEATADPTTPPSIHVSSGASSDANTDSSDLSVEDDVSIEATAEPAVSIKPIDTTQFRTEPAGSRTSTNASHPPLPPRRPYRFGFLGPIRHSDSDQSSSASLCSSGHHSFSGRHRERHQVTHGSNRKQNGSNSSLWINQLLGERAGERGAEPETGDDSEDGERRHQTLLNFDLRPGGPRPTKGGAEGGGTITELGGVDGEMGGVTGHVGGDEGGEEAGFHQLMDDSTEREGGLTVDSPGNTNHYHSYHGNEEGLELGL
ncbi:Trafficking protein particle complex subunit 1 [Nibea albiflora]|uniref:Trafficking protein particle complex subunit 1 n=1 Tax=Nibea albiflora TaxID=240163 RepID=A0ACB7EUH5_NIBAL|nr:Trafficking protein particle complex subunit 1 [Nibea albiflora]